MRILRLSFQFLRQTTMTNRSLRDRVTSSFFQKRNTIEKEKNRSKPLNPMKYMYKVESKVMSIDINFIGLFEYTF